MKNYFFFLALLSVCFACEPAEVPCPDGLTGVNCDETIIPKSVTVKSVKVLKYPGFRPNGSHWDNTETGANRYGDLSIQMGPNIAGVSRVVGSNGLPNADPAVTPSVTLSFLNPLDPERYKFTQSLTGFYFLGLYDSDCGSSTCTYEEMGVILFQFYTPGRAFPKALLLESPGNNVAFELEITNEY